MLRTATVAPDTASDCCSSSPARLTRLVERRPELVPDRYPYGPDPRAIHMGDLPETLGRNDPLSRWTSGDRWLRRTIGPDLLRPPERIVGHGRVESPAMELAFDRLIVLAEIEHRESERSGPLPEILDAMRQSGPFDGLGVSALE